MTVHFGKVTHRPIHHSFAPSSRRWRREERAGRKASVSVASKVRCLDAWPARPAGTACRAVLDALRGSGDAAASQAAGTRGSGAAAAAAAAALATTLALAAADASAAAAATAAAAAAAAAAGR